MANRLPYLNLGCGNILLPCARPAHHQLVDELIYAYPDWLNVDKHTPQNLNGNLKFECVNIFEYPWPWEDNHFDGALLGHIVEHVPHEVHTVLVGNWAKHEKWIERSEFLSGLQDGFYAFFAELYRVLTSSAIVHVLSPYGWSQGAITDPTHTRLITEHTFIHSMKPQAGDAFWYENGGIHFEMVGIPVYRLMERYHYLNVHPGDDEATITYKQSMLKELFESRINVVYDFYTQLQVVK